MVNFLKKMVLILRLSFSKPKETSILPRRMRRNTNVFPATIDDRTPLEASTPRENDNIVFGENFKLVLRIAAGFTLLFFIAAVIIAYVSFESERDLSGPLEDVFNICTHSVGLGFGAILGLLGGKAVS